MLSPRPVAGVRQRPFLEPPPLAQVSGHLGEAGQPAIGAPNRGDQHVGPEARAVSSQAPALLFIRPLDGGDGELALRLLRGEVLGRVEDREVLPDDLVVGVSVDALRALVPRGDAPSGSNMKIA